MNNDKIEIKARPKVYYYLNIFKKQLYKILKPIIFILIAIGTLYVGFYVLLFFILIIGISYFFNLIKNKF